MTNFLESIASLTSTMLKDRSPFSDFLLLYIMMISSAVVICRFVMVPLLATRETRESGEA